MPRQRFDRSGERPLEPERIQKLLAQAGLGSRRQIEQWMIEKRLTIDGKIAELGDKITGKERLSLDNRPLTLRKTATDKTRILIYHKPAGEICSRSDPEGRPTVFDSLPKRADSRWVAVGRLDFNTSGILLFTDNGALANKLMHPSSEIEREYAVRIRGEASKEELALLQAGVMLEDGEARFEDIRDAGGEGSNHWYHVLLKEGRNREVRRLWESQDLLVSRLIRVRFGPIQLPRNLRPGAFRDLTEEETKALHLSLRVKKTSQ